MCQKKGIIMLKTFICFYLTDSTSEEREVTSRNAVVTDIPETAFAYNFYDKNVVKAEDGELCYGMEKNESPVVYIDCLKLTVKDIQQLLASMEQNCDTAVVVTPFGEILSCGDDDIVVYRYDLEDKI